MYHYTSKSYIWIVHAYTSFSSFLPIYNSNWRLKSCSIFMRRYECMNTCDPHYHEQQRQQGPQRWNKCMLCKYCRGPLRAKETAFSFPRFLNGEIAFSRCDPKPHRHLQAAPSATNISRCHLCWIPPNEQYTPARLHRAQMIIVMIYFFQF